jgi:prepilin-type N-terminal cleavage/methylation domain-containing protein
MNTRQKGFTLIELLVVVAVIAVLAGMVLTALSGARKKSYEARTLQEMRSFEQAMELYLADHTNYPPDVSRNIPSGLEDYLGGGDWPTGPYPGSVYDWDNITGASPYVQLSLRFCDINGNNCNFPNEPWAANFDTYSAAYYCFQGTCRSHSSRPVNHPGYCLNCN